jgi:hypothetical protein
MQIGSVSTSDTQQLHAAQGTIPSIAQQTGQAQAVAASRSDRDGDSDGSTSTVSDSRATTGKQLNVVA